MALRKIPHPEVPREARPRRTQDIFPTLRDSCPASQRNPPFRRGAEPRATGHAPAARCARPRRARSRRGQRPPEPRPASAGHRRPCVAATDRSRDALPGRWEAAAAATVERRAAATDEAFGRSDPTAPRVQRPGRKIGHAPLGIADAARPTAKIAGASLGETPARVARARQKEIRVNRLKFFNSLSGKQEITGTIRRIGNYFRHRRGSGTKEASIWVHPMFLSRRQNRSPSRFQIAHGVPGKRGDAEKTGSSWENRMHAPNNGPVSQIRIST